MQIDNKAVDAFVFNNEPHLLLDDIVPCWDHYTEAEIA